MFIQDLPTPIKALIRKEYLRDLKDSFGEYVEAYIFSVTSIASKPLLFTAHTVDGAVISRLPISAFTLKPSEPMRLEQLQLWGALSENINVIEHKYLKGYSMKVKITGVDGFLSGKYLFTVDSREGGFSETPDQHKTFNVGYLEGGALFALPNNRCLFIDQHFAEYKGRPDYLTNTHAWEVETQGEAFNVAASSEVFYKDKSETD